ncbi:MAG: HoxN/HupN/NixA family nickel/cobalt transporter [Steroidobacteraceae bacterium]
MSEVLGVKKPQPPPAGVVAWQGLGFSRAECLRLSGFYGAVALLHVCGWGLCLYYSRLYPALLGMGFAAYMFGLRHAFDADHIAAVDDTIRYLLEKGKRPLGIGFFFSLGHSTIVFLMALCAVFAAASVRRHLPQWQELGGLIGGGISAGFLWLIGALNLLVLLKILRVRHDGDGVPAGHSHLEELLHQRGFLNRLWGRWVRPLINHSWQMYPLGLLFGLGFDTASEVGLLAMTAGAATGHIPLGAIISLPILFAAGMSAMDTTDGVLMSKAYDWALINPARRIVYNITLTSLSVAVALVIGTIEWLQVMIGILHLQGGFWAVINKLDFTMMGYVVVALFLGAWILAVILWKVCRRQQRGAAAAPHRHEHLHEDGLRHSHRHFH